MSDITIVYVGVELIDPNPWNPNRQNDDEFTAELQSIETFGFIAPIIVRPKPEHDLLDIDPRPRFEVIDGEHRLRAALQLEHATVPAVVLDLTDVQAKKLTVVMNETRGKADPALLGKLFADLQAELGDLALLSHALPFDERTIADFIELASFDWSKLDTPSDAAFDGHAPTTQQLVCVVSLDVAARWAQLAERYPGQLPTSGAGAANGALLTWVLEQVEGITQEVQQ